MLVQRYALIAVLAGRVAKLEARLAKNSKNSFKPPSSDGLGKPAPKSLRKPSGRKPGKQQGDPGFRLQPRAVPDEVRTHVPRGCLGCGAELTGAPVVDVQTRQVFDVLRPGRRGPRDLSAGPSAPAGGTGRGVSG